MRWWRVAKAWHVREATGFKRELAGEGGGNKEREG